MSTSIVLWVGALGLPGVEAVPVMVVALGLCSTVAVALCRSGTPSCRSTGRGSVGAPAELEQVPVIGWVTFSACAGKDPDEDLARRRRSSAEDASAGRCCSTWSAIATKIAGCSGPGCSTRRPSLTAR